MNTPSSNIPSDDRGALPGHGPTARTADPTGGRSDPQRSGTTGHDRDLLGSHLGEQTAALHDRMHGGASRQQSEFRAFLDDLSQLVKSQRPQSELRGEIDRRVSQARDRMSSAFDSATQAGSAAGDRVRRGIGQSRDLVADRPLQAILAAAAAGLVVGWLLSGDRD